MARPTAAKKATASPERIPAPPAGINVLGGGDNRTEGFDVGEKAPHAMYAEIGPDGVVDLDTLSKTPPVGKYANVVVAEGDTVSQAVYDQLNHEDADE